jgi:Xaa-Pro aminopeptidase
MVVDRHLAFSEEEYARRLAAVREHMVQRGADALLVDETEHLGYLTGFAPSATMYQACIVPLDRDPIMVLRQLDVPSFVESTWLSEHVGFRDWDDPLATVVDTLEQRGFGNKRIALELDGHFLTARHYTALTAALPEATVVDFSDVLWELRLIKSAEEIDYLRQACRIADQAMIEALDVIGEGKSEREAAAAAAAAYYRLGADNGSVGPIASGSRTESLHGGLRDHRLQRGEIIHLELVPQVQGYSARMMRPAVIGEPSAEQDDTARALIEIQDQQIAAMKPGAIGKDVDRICREGILQAGLRERYDNTTGYTLGYYASKMAPRSSDFTRIFTPDAEWRLEPGMVFHMYTTGKGLSFSETVLVTETVPERLTRLERTLFAR